MCLQQRMSAAPVSLKESDFVMLRVIERNSKLSPKFVCPRQIVRQLGAHTFEICDLILNAYETVHAERLKKTSAQPEVSDSTLTESAKTVQLRPFSLSLVYKTSLDFSLILNKCTRI